MNRNIMLIGNGKSIFNAGYFVEFSACDHAVLGAVPEKEEPLKLAFYQNREQSKFALGLVIDAMRADDDVFEFPKAADIEDLMEYARQHRAKVTSRKRSHGGS